MIGNSRPIVKHSFTVDSAENIPEIVKHAFHIATSGRPGPVVIDVPKDTTAPDKLFDFVYPEKVNIRSYNPPINPEKEQIERAVEAILDAEKPVIYAGGGAINSNASEELLLLNKILDFPVTNTLMGLGIYPATHERFLGMLGMHGTYQANMAMHNADLIKAVGARFDDRITNTPSLFAPNAKIIHLDVDHSSVSKIIEANIAVFGQVKNSLTEIIKSLETKKELIDSKKISHRKKQISEWQSQHGLNHEMYLNENDDNPIMPQAVVQHIYNITKGNAYITSDVGQHQMFAAQ